MDFHARLVRDTQTSLWGTFGELFLYNGTFGFTPIHTVEDDWKDNEPGESCIPKGKYTCKRTIYHKHNIETFEITGVPGGRTRCLFHVANTENDVKGCVGLGLRRGILNVVDEDSPAHKAHGDNKCNCPLVPHDAVVNSQPAFRKFMDTLAHVDEFELEIL